MRVLSLSESSSPSAAEDALQNAVAANCDNDCDDCDTESDHACDCYTGNG
jgi:hypothetical protein